ncbi:MAG: hypothetical protein RIC55_20120 [Pirellulaceae bacterium]
MSSVILSWSGHGNELDRRQELYFHLAELAERSRLRAAADQPNRLSFLETLAQQRREGVSTPPFVRDHTIESLELTGRIVMDFSPFTDEEAARQTAQTAGVTLLTNDEGHKLLQFERLTVEGLDFDLYDPRGLYPHENRASFLFARSGTMPHLDGALVHVVGRESCQLYDSELVRDADWYITKPHIHLRYYLEDWSDLLLAWIKYFFLPELDYHRYEHLSRWDDFREAFDMQIARGVDRDDFQQKMFAMILNDFEREADQWCTTVGSMAL